MSLDQDTPRKSSGRRKRRPQADPTLEAFRRDTGGAKLRGNTARPPISLREKTITLLLALSLVFPVWLKGSMSSLAQWVTLALVASAFLMLWVPMGAPNILNLNAPPSLAGRTLVRFPLFWLGLALLGYVLIAALNPAIEVSFLRNNQIFNEVDFIPWLPHGVDAPFPLASSWKVLLQWGTLWLAVCALWAGCRRRRTVHFLFWIVAINAAIVGLMGSAHSFSGSWRYLWIGESLNGYSMFGPFLYDNHAAAYLVVCLGTAASLFLIHFARAAFTRNGSYVFLGTLALVTVATLFITRSRAGIVIGSVAFLLFLILLVLVYRRQNSSMGGVAWLGALLFGGGTILLMTLVPWKRLGKDFGTENIKLVQADMSFRSEAYKATYDMWKDAPVLGWGPGSFRYVFSQYQEQSPILSAPGRKGPLHWAQAHNDWLQALAELGLVGVTFILAGIFWIYSRLWSWRRLISPSTLMALGTGALVMGHAGVDFVFQNPAILLTWLVLVLGSLRLLLSERELGA